VKADGEEKDTVRPATIRKRLRERDGIQSILAAARGSLAPEVGTVAVVAEEDMEECEEALGALEEEEDSGRVISSKSDVVTKCMKEMILSLCVRVNNER
jgi:hypothetical protein